MATLLWPIHVLRARDISVDVSPRSLRGPASVSGFSQVVSSDAGLFKITLGGIIIRSRAEVLAFRAIANLLEGQLNPINIPICRAYQPVPAGAVAAGLYDEVPHSDDAYFDDDTGYVGTVIDVVAAANAAVRAVSMTVTVNYAGDIESGQHFSVGDGRLYRVRTFDADTGALTFRPPLREAVTAGDRLEFDNPILRCRLAADDSMNLELAGRRFGSPSVAFLEDI
ncbi:hypothetical protein [Allomesorhizobium camelthorni]|uniref:Uncharacterized protein n=1 Tax=Allomesorhizobium camelthorni TaxID=475069 RepID=A0A6G4WBW0_9HYPH|nr:hypothetical protein [Mesorhizobium camelthorni]NGO51607.1 hypothetical protein [Mesorhizobium camelthorni]